MSKINTKQNQNNVNEAKTDENVKYKPISIQLVLRFYLQVLKTRTRKSELKKWAKISHRRQNLILIDKI